MLLHCSGKLVILGNLGIRQKVDPLKIHLEIEDPVYLNLFMRDTGKREIPPIQLW